MTEFQAYLSFGFDHIFNIAAYDHILFIATLVAAYPLTLWKRMILIVTAFTVGHSATLALSAMGLFTANMSLVEVLIAATILITATYNILSLRGHNSSRKLQVSVHYVIAFSFGLIHGLGFAGQFHDLMGSGNQFILALFAFNIGVELGQIAVIGILLIILLVFTCILKVRHQLMSYGISIIAGIIAIILIIQRMQSV